MRRHQRSIPDTARDTTRGPRPASGRAGTAATAAERGTPSTAGDEPKTPFSVVVPTCDRPRQLIRLLDSLVRIHYPPTRFEVVVVDDGSCDPVEPQILHFRRSLELIVVRQDNRGPGAARNVGVRVAGGEHIAFIDDDCAADPAWLTAFDAGVATRPAALHGGRVVNGLTDNPYATASQLLLDHLYRHYAAGVRLGGFYTANNLCVPRSGFQAIGGFDPALRFGEDRDLCYRWALPGNEFRFVRDALVHHAHAVDLPGLLRLHFCYGGGSYDLHRKVAASGLPRVETSPPSVYLGLLLAGIRHRRGLAGLRLSALLTAMQAASATGMVHRAITRPRRGG